MRLTEFYRRGHFLINLEEKRRDMTQSFDKSPNTNRKFKKQSDSTNNANKNN